MKAHILILFTLFSYFGIAQSNLTIFNNDGRQFYVIMNGIKQNSVPQTNVYISNIKNGVYSVKLIFADGITADIDKNIYCNEPSDITTRVKFKNGKGSLQMISLVPTVGPLQGESVVVYRSANTAAYTDAPQQQTVVTTTTPSTTVTTPAQTTTVTTTTTSSQVTNTGTVQPASSNGNVGVNMSVNVPNTTVPSGQVGLNMQVNVTDPMMTGNGGVQMNMNVSDPMMNNGNVNMNIGTTGLTTNSQTSQTTVTTTTTTQAVTPPPTTVQVQQVPVQTTTVTSGCRNILGDGDQFARDLKDLSFDSDRKEAILGDLATYCLTASQAYKIIETLNYDSDRLEASKFLFERMIDKDKGNVLLPLLTFDSSKMEYREHMRKFK